MDKTSIKIQNVGPIKSVVIDDLKRVNVFIGASASGKSTIAKIITQAIWCEKAFITTGREVDFKEQLISFHRLADPYFSENSRIEYHSPDTSIIFKKKGGKQLRFTTEYEVVKDKSTLYKNVKVQYIPAERNFVTSIPNLQEYNKAYDNVFSFLQDWLANKAQYRDLRTSYQIQDLEGLKLKFRTLRDGTLDIVRTGGTNIDVELLNSSSGIQSILPLMLVTDEVLDKIYNKTRPFSYSELNNLEKIAAPEFMPIIKALNDMSRNTQVDRTFRDAVEQLWKAVGYSATYSKTFLTIEEPEQNIYPSTQRSLVNHILQKLGEKSSLLITTHSPYILYAFDNALVAGQVAGGSRESKKILTKEFPHLPTSFTDDEVALWQVSNGSITSLISPDTHSLGQNEFNFQLGKSVNEMSELYTLQSEYNDDGQQ